MIKASSANSASRYGLGWVGVGVGVGWAWFTCSILHLGRPTGLSSLYNVKTGSSFSLSCQFSCIAEVKRSLCLIRRHSITTYWETRGTVSFILSMYVGEGVGQVHAAAFFTLAERERAIGDWVDSRPGQDSMKGRKNFTTVGNRTLIGQVSVP